MQSKVFIRVIAVLLAIVCLFYLSFSLVTNNVENDAAASAQKTAAAAAVKVDKDTKSEAYRHVYDSVYNKAYAKYLKDIGQEEVYMWYTYNEVREKQIGLGLDLKGGMTVTLQISVADIVRSKATNPQDAKLNEALAYASENPENDFVGVFCKKYEELVPGVSLAQKFNRVDGVNANDGNSTVEGILREKTRSDISKSVNLLRERIDRFGVIAPNIKEMQREGQILMELPGVKEPERVYKLIQSSAKLEFYATYTMDNEEYKLSGSFESNKGKLPFPVTGNYRIVRPFGRQKHPELKYVETNNMGIDIEADQGAMAVAIFDGKVSAIFKQPGFNNIVMVRHGNYLTVYAGLASINVKTGDTVKGGQAIGTIFSDIEDENRTLLHFEIRKERQELNPELWLK